MSAAAKEIDTYSADYERTLGTAISKKLESWHNKRDEELKPFKNEVLIMTVKITGVTTILTAPEGINLVVVRIDTNQPGLYGLGCATFAYRALTVKSLIDDYLSPL